MELDGITRRIAKQLYPKANIKISGFEKTDYPNDFFDVAVGNVPFGQYKVTDKLETAKIYVENHPEYTVNVQALTQVQPKELDASEIEVRIVQHG